FLHLIEVTAPYQSSLAQVDWVEGPLPGRPVLAFNPASLITMRGIAPASTAGAVRFTDVTGESGLPDGGGPITALALGDYDGDGKRFEEVTETAGLRDVDGGRRALFVDVDHDGDLDLVLVGGGSLAVYRDNLDGTFTPFPNADGITRGGSDAAFGDFDDDGRTDIFVASTNGGDALFHNDGVKGFTDAAAGTGPRSNTVAVGDYDNDGS